MNELTIQATLTNAQAVNDFIGGKLDEVGCSKHIRVQIMIAVDELFSNIARYAYFPGHGPATIRAEVDNDPLSVTLTFIDRGMPYDPLSAEDPDVTLPASARRIGGLGIFMVRKSMDNIAYEYKDGRNILTVRKMLDDAPVRPEGRTPADE